MAINDSPYAGRSRHKKGPTKGSGGQRRRGLRGKGPTPKAEDRTYHVAYQRKLEREAEAAKQAQREQYRRRTAIKIARGHELIVGRNSVDEALNAGIVPTRVFIAGDPSDERIMRALQTATAHGAPVFEVTKLDLLNASQESAHQGIGIEVPEYEYCTALDLIDRCQDSGETPLIVALDQVTDPHNLGAAIRNAGAFNATGLLISQRRSASVNSTVWKVSAGAIARVPVARETNLVTALKTLKSQGCFIVGLAGDGDTEVGECDLITSPLVLVTGAEGRGLSRLVRDTCDAIVSIPISSAVESLNASVATGIALYEVARARRVRV